MLSLKLNNKFNYVITEGNDKEVEQCKVLLTRFFDEKKYKYDPRVKKGLWDGKIKMYDKNTLEIPYNLGHWVKKEMEKMGYEVSIDHPNIGLYDVDFETFEKVCLIATKNWKNKPVKHQIEAAYSLVSNRNSRVEIATGGGKTLIAYMTLVWFMKAGWVSVDKPMLYLVPRIDLAYQSGDDFVEYSGSKLKYGVITDGRDTSEGNYVVFATYQSVVDKDPEYLKKFNVIFTDEAHMATTKSFSTIFDKRGENNLLIRCGVSGTFEKSKDIKELTYIKYLGDIKYVINSSDLEDVNFVVPCEFRVVYLKHIPEDKCKLMYNARMAMFSKAEDEDAGIDSKMAKELYETELSFMRTSEKRIEYIAKLVVESNENCAIFFRDIKSTYGKRLASKIKEKLKDFPDRKVYYVDGSVNATSRKEIYSRMKVEKGSVLLGSYGVFSTGVSINNLFMAIFAEPLKSYVQISQSVGRMMRLFEGKGKAIIYDIVDDFSYDYPDLNRIKNFNGSLGKGHVKFNTLLKGSRERLKIYHDRQSEINFIEEDLLL